MCCFLCHCCSEQACTEHASYKGEGQLTTQHCQTPVCLPGSLLATRCVWSKAVLALLV